MTSPLLLFVAAIGLVAVLTCMAVVAALSAHDLPSRPRVDALSIRMPAGLLVRY